MANSNKIPESVEDVKRNISKMILSFIIKKPFHRVPILLLVVAVLLVLSARFNLFSDSWYRYSKIIIPIHIPLADPEVTAISLIFKYEIEDSKGRRSGVLGDNLYSGDLIFFSFRTNSDCWVSLFGVDSKGIFPLWNNKFSPEKIEKNSDYPIQPFALNETIGNEIYFIVASDKKFNFDKSIRPHLDKLFPQGSSKGPAFSKYQMELPDNFVHQFIYFNHLSRP